MPWFNGNNIHMFGGVVGVGVSCYISSPQHCFSLCVSVQLPPCSKSFQEAQTDLNHTAAELNHSAGEVVHSSRGTSSQLAVASGKFSQDFDEFLDAGIEMAGHTQVQV